MNFTTAREHLKSVLLPTHLIYSPLFSEESGNKIYIKPENLQKTGAFKIRGAYNKILKLTEEEKKRGVIAASAGNHAQGGALAAKKEELLLLQQETTHKALPTQHVNWVSKP